MRVVHLTLGLDVGGQEKLLVEFARHADRSRFDLHFVSLGSRGDLAGELESCGWPVTALESPAGLRPGLVLRLARLFARLGADVVHTHDDRPNIHGAPAAWLAGVRRVIHTRHSQGTWLTRRQQYLVRAAALFNDRFVCISQDSARHAVRQGVPRRKVEVLHNGIDLGRFPYCGPAACGPAAVVARLVPEKDIATLLRAAAILVKRQPGFRLVIAGDGPGRGELEALAAELRLGESVRFVGVIHDVAGLLSTVRLFVLPSLTEGISLTLLESMARGLPVVATAVGGNPEVVDNETGLLVPAGDPSALADAVERLWTDAGLCVEMGCSGRRRAERLFDIRRMVAQYEDLYFRQ
jgi:glycosyltransferase involved in cell wall biosynthesis